jgi:D-alanyl-D-alanine dipeptidase
MPIPAPRLDFETFSIGQVAAGPEPFRLVNRVPIRDNGEPLVDLRETNPELSFGVNCLPYVRESVAAALKIAFKNTPVHLDLRVSTGLRTLQEQADMYWHNYQRARDEDTGRSESTLRRMTNRFFAPPDAKAPPGHCTGAAVDVGLLDRETERPLDVSSPLKGWKGAPTGASGLSPQASENRRLLCHIMHSTGLSNCRTEFWHWSYGDSAWATRVGAPVAVYGLVEPPPGATRVTGPKIRVVPYDPDWPRQFEELRTVLAAKLGPLTTRIEHVGSTAVPGLSAKSILDVDIVVPDRDGVEAAIAALAELGYTHQGDLGIPGRDAFRRESDEVPKAEPARRWPEHHLYVCVEGTSELLRHVAFRDYMRAHRADAEEYAALKRTLSARYPWDRTRYTDGKAPLVTRVLEGCAL